MFIIGPRWLLVSSVLVTIGLTVRLECNIADRIGCGSSAIIKDAFYGNNI